MKQIWFKFKYFDLIKKGDKCSTIRIWKRNNLSEHDEVQLFFGFTKPKLLAKINKINFIKIRDLTDSCIKEDGFKTKKEFYKALKECYPNNKNIKDLFAYQIYFKIINND